DVRRCRFLDTVRELHQRSNVFEPALIEACRPELEAWSANIRPGTVQGAGSTIGKLAELPESQRTDQPRHIIDRIPKDRRQFRASRQLDQVVVINVASTEPPFPLEEVHTSAERLLAALDKRPNLLPASSLYAWAALDLGWPYVNFTPSLGASFPAALEL